MREVIRPVENRNFQVIVLRTGKQKGQMYRQACLSLHVSNEEILPDLAPINVESKTKGTRRSHQSILHPVAVREEAQREGSAVDPEVLLRKNRMNSGDFNEKCDPENDPLCSNEH